MRVAAVMSAKLGVVLMAHGLGAECAHRVAGHGGGAADYRTPCGRLHAELTDPLHANLVAPSAALWIGPDKLEAAEGTLTHGSTTILVHHLPASLGEGLLRYAVLDALFLARWRMGSFTTIIPSPRGAAERYVEVPAHDPAVLQGAARSASRPMAWRRGCWRLSAQGRGCTRPSNKLAEPQREAKPLRLRL